MASITRFDVEEHDGRESGLDALRDQIEVFFESVDRAEVELVVRTVTAAERLRLDRVAKAVTWLGNGWLYPILSFVLLVVLDVPARHFAGSLGSVILAFTIYPGLKNLLGRARPCDYDPSLRRHGEPLDQYSCPSGHAMTAAAYSVPLAFSCPNAIGFAVALCALVGWSRVALGHHYVSDVLLGITLGTAIASAVVVVVT